MLNTINDQIDALIVIFYP